MSVLKVILKPRTRSPDSKIVSKRDHIAMRSVSPVERGLESLRTTEQANAVVLDALRRLSDDSPALMAQ